MKFTIVVTDDADNYAGTIILINQIADPEVVASAFQNQLTRLYETIQAEDDDNVLRDKVVELDETLTKVKESIGEIYGIAEGYRRERPEGLVLDSRQGRNDNPSVESSGDFSYGAGTVPIRRGVGETYCDAPISLAGYPTTCGAPIPRDNCPSARKDCPFYVGSGE